MESPSKHLNFSIALNRHSSDHFLKMRHMAQTDDIASCHHSHLDGRPLRPEFAHLPTSQSTFRYCLRAVIILPIVISHNLVHMADKQIATIDGHGSFAHIEPEILPVDGETPLLEPSASYAPHPSHIVVCFTIIVAAIIGMMWLLMQFAMDAAEKHAQPALIWVALLIVAVVFISLIEVFNSAIARLSGKSRGK